MAGERFTVVVLRWLGAEDEALDAFLHALAVTIPLVLVLAAIGGYLLARASLAPVVAMARQAERTSVRNLNERLPVANPRDELGGLAVVLNGLLARLEEAFDLQQRAANQQRQFMADASHELRTPVTALCSVADVALARPDRDPTELVEALDVVRGEGRRLGRVVDDLLLLARADAGELPVRPEPLFLEELIQDCARAARAMAASRQITLIAPPADEAPLTGDPHLLRRLLMILLDNAIKYTSPGGQVQLSLTRVDTSTAECAYEIAVEDSGTGVPLEAREKIFERFFRADMARTRHPQGDAPGVDARGSHQSRLPVPSHAAAGRGSPGDPVGSRPRSLDRALGGGGARRRGPARRDGLDRITVRRIASRRDSRCIDGGDRAGGTHRRGRGGTRMSSDARELALSFE